MKPRNFHVPAMMMRKAGKHEKSEKAERKLRNQNIAAEIFEELQLRKTVSENGTIIYTNGNVLHRRYGPAAAWPDGEKHWYQNGLLHRSDGPAVERKDGTSEYYLYDTYYYDVEKYLKEVERIKNENQ